MGHYALVIDERVEKVITAEEDSRFIKEMKENTEGSLIQTSYNTYRGKHYDPETGEPDDGTPIRANFAGKGMVYDSNEDVFYDEQPYPSWNLNKDGYYWEPPVKRPDDENSYDWDEETRSWVVIEE